MRVFIINNIPAPYFDPVFKILGERQGWELTVCYTASWNRQAGWVEGPLADSSYRTVVLDRAGRGTVAGYHLLREMFRQRPEFLIVYGYTLIPQCLSILWGILNATPYALIGDANVFADTATGLKGTAKRTWINFVVRRARALIAIGTANRMFWERYGAKPAQLFCAPYAVDNDHFEREVRRARKDPSELKGRLGITAKTVFLFAGRLVRRKNVDLIVRAMRALPSQDVALVIVGDGDQRQSLESIANGDVRIVFAGAVAQTDLPLYYAIADCLVLPAADEPWGLVVNEAMASGLAVIAHKECGSAVDLVTSDNGVVLETFEQMELERALDKLSRDELALSAMKRASLERISRWTIAGAARGIIDAVEAFVPGSPALKREAVVEEVK